MRNIFSKFALVATLGIALAFTFSCSAVDDAINGSSSSSGGNEQSYDYCITAAGCLPGPFTASTCTGQLSNGCPNSNGSSPSSSPSVGSSSSVKSSSSSSSSSNVTLTYSLDGIWENNDNKGLVTVSGSTGVVSAFADVNSATGQSALMQSAMDKGYVTLNSATWRNLKSTGNLIWSGELKVLTVNKSNPNVATGVTWINATFTLSADGQTLTIKGTDSNGDFTDTFTRKQ